MACETVDLPELVRGWREWVRERGDPGACVCTHCPAPSLTEPALSPSHTLTHTHTHTHTQTVEPHQVADAVSGAW